MNEPDRDIQPILDLYDDLQRKASTLFPQDRKFLLDAVQPSTAKETPIFKAFESKRLADANLHTLQLNDHQLSANNINVVSDVSVQNRMSNDSLLAKRGFYDINNQSQALVAHSSQKTLEEKSSHEIAISHKGSKFKGRPQAKIHSQWKLKKVIAGHNGWVRSVSFDPSNEFFATGSTDRTIKFWDLASGILKLTFTGHVSTIRCVEISKNHPYLFSCSEDKSVRCWDLNTNKCIRNFHGHLSGVYSLSLHPELNILASGGRDAVVRLWDIRSRQQIHVFEGHSDIINSVVMQKDEPQLLSASSDSTIRMWDIVSGKTFNVLTNHKKGIRSLKAHPIEYSFVSAAADNMKLWKCPEGSFIRNFDKEGVYEIINAVDISGEDILVAGYDNGKIRFWDWESGKIFQTIDSAPQPGSLEAEAGVFDLKFDLSSTRLVTCECDKTIKIWQQESL